MGLKVGQTENESLFSDSPRYATLRLTTCHKKKIKISLGDYVVMWEYYMCFL